MTPDRSHTYNWTVSDVLPTLHSSQGCELEKIFHSQWWNQHIYTIPPLAHIHIQYLSRVVRRLDLRKTSGRRNLRGVFTKFSCSVWRSKARDLKLCTYTVRSDKCARFKTLIVNDLFNIFPKFQKYVKAADDTYLVCFLKPVYWLLNYRSREHGYFTN